MRGACELHGQAIYGLIDLEGLYWQLLRKSGDLPFGMSLPGKLKPIHSVSGIC